MQTISVNSTIAQANGFAVEVADSVLLSNRYFPNSEGDNFAGGEVLLDFDDSDLEKGAFLTTTYKSGETVSWRGDAVIPPRVAVEDSVDPKGLDRVVFERLCRAQGQDLNRKEAYQDLLALKAARNAKRADRAIELLAALVIKEGKIEFDQPHDNSVGAEDDHICIKYYSPSKGCNNHYVPAIAWGSSGATPYKDVCAMITAMAKMGKRPTDLVMGAEAWAHLVADEAFKYFPQAIHTEGANLSTGEIDGAQDCGSGIFNGIKLNLICYSGAYKDGSGELQTYIDKDAVILIAEGCGRCLQGGCTLLNPDSVGYGIENSFVDLTGRHCQSIYKDFNTQKIYIREESRPLPAPKHSVNELDWVYCDTTQSATTPFVGVVYSGLEFKHINAAGETVTPTTPASCTATMVKGGSDATITAAATTDKTYKYYPSIDGKAGAELTLSGTTLKAIAMDCDREDDKAIIFVIEQ